MVQPSVLTISEAGAALNLSGPRIHQLLASGDLEGPPLPLGRKRHSPGAPRVSRESITRYLEFRRASDDSVPANHLPHVGRSANQEGEKFETRTDAALAATHELKVRLDAMRDELRAERGRSRELLNVIEKLIDMLRSSQNSADQLDDVTESYSQALTQVLVEDPPAGE